MSSVYDRLAQLSPARRALFEQRLAARGLQASAAQVIPARAADAVVPLSFAQQRLWFLQQLAPGNTAYNVSSVLRLDGRLDHRALGLALSDIVARHEALRTSFVAGDDGTPVQRIHAHVALELSVTDLSAEADPRAAAMALVDAMRGTAFDLSAPPLRLALLARADDDHLLVMCTHHIVCDRWSVMVFLRELSANYAAHAQAGSAALSALPIQYADWTLWQREQLQGEKIARLLDYWRTRLAALPAALDLPTARPASAIAGTAGAQWPLAFSAELTAGLRALAHRERTTLFTVLLAAFQALLHRYTGATDVVVGTEVANRDRPETAGLIGLLVNTLVLRGDLSGDPSYRTLLAQTREHVLGALAHQELPFEKLVETLNPARGLHQMTPLFEVKFDLQQVPVRPPAADGLTFEREALTETETKYLLRFNLQDGADGLRGQIEYSTDRFDAQTIARMAEHYAVLLAGSVTAPDARLSALPLLPAWERERLLVEWNRTQAARPEGALHALVEARAAASPTAIAVIDMDREWTYRELDDSANRLAARLRALGVRAEQPVGVSMARRGELIVALLGILKAGGAYVPLDPAYPAQRLSFIAEDAGMRLVLNDGTDWPAGIANVELLDVAEIVAQTAPVSGSTVNVAPAQLAYVIYTSGSTGRPKGVAIEHRSAVALMHWARARFDDAELAGVLAATSICFDLSVFEIFVPLAWGGTLILADNVLALPDLPARERVSLINTVPSVMRQLLERGALPASAATVNLAGEALPLALVRELQAQPQMRRLYNLYGPSEDTTYSTCAPLSREEFGADCSRVTIGTPIENTRAYVLDAHGEPVPIGIAGELYLGGAGLARGYFGRAAQTAASFVPNPFAADPPVLYRTGDRARRLADGSLEFLGRDDHQIKIRGFRIEAGEIEAALREHPALRDALVIAHEDARGDRRLLAYVVGDDPADVAPATLRAFLAERLPAHAIPSLWIHLPALPRLPNGKVDRSALPPPNAQEARKVEVRAPRTPTERTLCELWCDLLQRPAIGIDEDFFDLGGHSLLAFQLVARIDSAFGCRVALRALFQHSTIASLAAHVDELERSDPTLRRSAPRPPLVHDAAKRGDPFPLTDIQQAYWLGRSGVFELGNIATHGYREIETSGLAVTAVEQALNALIRRHDMLRVVVTPEGQQRVLPEVPTYAIALTDLRGLPATEADAALSALRERLSHQLFAPDTWPLFQIEAALHGDGRTRFFVSFDVLIGDAWSLQILGREMGRLLLHESLPPLALSFRDYVLAQAAQTTTDAYRQSFEYWRARLPELPPAPELPLLLAPSQLETPRFVRRSGQLPAADWTALKARARRAGLTPTSLVLAAFAEVLATWSRRRAFTLNLTLFNRDPVHPDVEKLVGDFTSSLLLAVDAGGDLPFARQATRLQARLLEDLEHRAVSGVRILRELARDSGRRTGALMPVVFTSTLSQPATSTPRRGWQAQVIYGVSQTSQVYFDHQVSETDGALTFNWDTIDALFPPGVLDEMFAAYAGFLTRLATTFEAFEQRPRLADAGYLDPFNDTALSFGTDAPALLHTRFFEHARARPAAPAVLTADITLSYGELAQRVLALAAVLRSHEIARNELVAIGIAKGWTQVVAALAVLTAGGAYVPIDPDLPRVRRAQLLADTASRFVLVDARSPEDWPAEVITLAVDAAARSAAISLDELPAPLQAPTDLAYVIYTSGSTGMPKGVMIDHRGALNTVIDLNARFGLRADDRVFALSALNFDLSVYDLFGPLTAGAALVMPDAARLHDSRHWRELLCRHEVTIWNSVPALMQLLVTELEGAADGALPSSLRLALLSGDWIPVPLPATLGRLLPQMKVVSLGGATEASIWSIAHPIDTVDPAWKSIPYGRPLANQQWLVLDERMAPCPPWVTGQLYIGGIGLARGYWRRPALSAEQFVPNPFASSAAGDGMNCLYRTGDLGRYCADGHLEFLGREDFQVKINGHRIELGEIETALQQHPLIAQAVVTVIGSPPELLAYVVPALGERETAQDPLARLDFKRARHARIDEPAAGIALPPPAATTAHLARQSHRRFLAQPIPFEAFAALLGALSAQTLAAAPLPKFRYPSAGSLYPIEIYLSVKPGRVTDLDGGWYRYEPHAHRLLPVAASAAPDTACCYGPNAAVFAESAFSLFLIADLAAIEPLYGARARDFCLLEAGYIGQLLMECAPAQDLGLCPVNDPELAALRELLSLSEQQTPVHALLGGAIDPAWSTSWRALEAPRSASLTERLQASLREKLPAYMVPGRYHLLDALPLSANGKVDRRALPVPDITAERIYTPPRNELEARVVELWATLLEVERVGVEDDFFQLGGNSLLALQLLTQLRQHFTVDLAIADLFGALTPAAQAALIAAAQTTATPPAAIQPIARAPSEHELSDEAVDALLAKLLSSEADGQRDE